MFDTASFESRKREHINLSMQKEMQAIGFTGLDQVRLFHDPLPEMNFCEVDISTKRLGRLVRTPFFVSSMTAGHGNAFELNFLLAEACSNRGWGFGVGSQRRDLEVPSSSIDQWSAIREKFPELEIYSNIGLSQLIDSNADEMEKIIALIGASALIVHLNPLQEALQKEGTPNFRGGIKKIAEISEQLSVPIILKETGCGFSKVSLEKIKGLNFKALDVSGLGGTHWGRIEGARSDKNSIIDEAAKIFMNWGNSTVESVINARNTIGGADIEVWGSGGVRSGLDAAKLIALGANSIGFAKPVLEAALLGGVELNRWMERIEFELRIAMFCTGSNTLSKLSESVEKC